MPGIDDQIRDVLDLGLSDRVDLANLHANRFGLGTVQTGLFPGKDQQATSSSPLQSRSESVIAINPMNESNMVGASKKFTDPAKYHFKLGPIYTFDGGSTWHESTLPLEVGWDGMTDPTVAFDTFGHAFLVGEPLRFERSDLEGLGMAVYRSSDGGVTWEQPFRLTTNTSDDKQWVLCDNNPGSPHRGNVYVTWRPRRPCGSRGQPTTARPGKARGRRALAAPSWGMRSPPTSQSRPTARSTSSGITTGATRSNTCVPRTAGRRSSR